MRSALFMMIFCMMVHAGGDTPLTAVYQINVSRVLKTGDHRGAQRTILETVNLMDGWLINAEPQSITLRVPADSVAKFLVTVDSLGLIADPVYQRTDRSADYLGLVAGIQSKEFLLQQYLQVLDSSGVQGIYPVSKSIADLQQGIELLKGQLRGMLERMEFAEVKVYFQFIDRQPPPITGYSAFEWINTVNLPSLLEAFE